MRPTIKELEHRIIILETIVATLIDKTNVQDLSSPMVAVPEDEGTEMRTLIGFKSTPFV